MRKWCNGKETVCVQKPCELWRIANKDKENLFRAFSTIIFQIYNTCNPQKAILSNISREQLVIASKTTYCARKLHTVDVCWLLLSSGMLVEHSFSIARNRKISLDAAAKSDSSCSSFSRRRFSSRWHVCDTNWDSISFLRIKSLEFRKERAKNFNLIYFLLTTFCRSRSNLSHFSLVTSILKFSFSTTPSLLVHLVVSWVSAELMDSRPVSLSGYTAWSSSSSLLSELSSLSEITRCVTSVVVFSCVRKFSCVSRCTVADVEVLSMTVASLSRQTTLAPCDSLRSYSSCCNVARLLSWLSVLDRLLSWLPRLPRSESLLRVRSGEPRGLDGSTERLLPLT